MITIFIYFLTFFTKKIWDFYELVVCGAPGRRAGNGTRKGYVVYKQHPHAPNWCVNRYIPYVLRQYNTVV